MDIMIKKNHYYNLSQDKIAEIKKTGKRPTLLLHSCCAPCNSYVMVSLSEVFDLTLLYNNSNIYPKSEYDIRVNELKNYTNDVNKKYNLNIELLELEYNSQEFHKKLSLANDGREGGERCKKCFQLRMDEAYEYALKHDFDYFTTVMTISRHKDSIVLNRIGEDLNKKYNSEMYFFSNFKKKDGLLKSKEIIDTYDMYRQEYCGCAFSYKDYLNRSDNSGE